MISNSDLGRVTGATIYTNDGDKIGSANQVYLDDATGDPQWVTVNTGRTNWMVLSPQRIILGMGSLASAAATSSPSRSLTWSGPRSASPRPR